MKTCPVCEKGFPDQHRTCPADGALLMESNELEPGALVRGKYRIVKKIGQGGMGIVYLADNILMNVRVALKFLAGELGRDPRFVKRFRTEARTMFLLRHPNVAQVHDLDQTEDGALFLAMEFIDGPSLRSVIDSAPQGMPVPVALLLVRGIAAGLGAAHEHGTVHRDIKPENILLTSQNHHPKVLDFGIAAAREGAAAMSRTAGPLFTPEYAAPEQWKGMPSAELDGRTDIYSLGGVLYELLTGRTPFHAHNVQSWMSQHLAEAPAPPSQLRPELRAYPGLDELVLAMLAKERDQRPSTIGELMMRLDSVGQRSSGAGRTVLEPDQIHTPAPVLLPSFTEEPEEPRSGRGKWIGLALAAAVLLAVVVFAALFLLRAASPVDAPVLAPNGGTYPSSRSVILTETTPDAVVHYTTDGTLPAANSPTYTQPLTDLPTGTTVQAIAVKGGKVSGVASASYIWSYDVGKQAFAKNQYVEARPPFSSACEGGDVRACNYLGYLYAKGLGGPADVPQAQSLYQKSCDGGLMSSCASLGSIYEMAGKRDDAKINYKKACDGGSAEGCNLLKR